MRKLLFGTIASLFAATALANEYFAGDLQVVAHYEVGQPATGGSPRGTEATGYSNVTNFLGSAYAAGGAEVQGANTITRMVMDDCTFDGTAAGQSIVEFKFSIYNGNGATILARPRVRFWMSDGAGGSPGTYLNTGAGNIGFSFTPLNVGAGVTVVTASISAFPGLFLMPAANQTIWAGVVFDNNNATGMPGIGAAQLNNMGQGVFHPATIGSTADGAFQTTAAGSFFGTNNPAGAALSFNGNPPASFAWEFSAPEPASLALLALGGLLAIRRR